MGLIQGVKMKISEAIARLEQLKEEHGDEELRVVADPCERDRSNPFMKLRQNEITHGDIHKIEAGYRGISKALDPEQRSRSKFIFVFAG